MVRDTPVHDVARAELSYLSRAVRHRPQGPPHPAVAEITADTATCHWRGERTDYGLAIEVLLTQHARAGMESPSLDSLVERQRMLEGCQRRRSRSISYLRRLR